MRPPRRRGPGLTRCCSRRARPALRGGVRRARDGTADLPGHSGRRDPFLVVPRLELPAAQASPAGRLGLETGRLGRDRRSVRAGGAAARQPGRGRSRRPDVGPDGAQVRARTAGRAAGTGQPGARPAPLAQVSGRGGGAARGGPGDRPGARAGARLAAGGPHRAAGRGGHRDAILAEGHAGSTSRSSPPARTRPARITPPATGCCARATRGRRHRRHDADRVLLRLHEDLRDRPAAG